MFSKRRETTCEECKSTKAMLSGMEPPCTTTCGYVTPIRKNMDFFKILGKHYTLIKDGWGVMNPTGIQFILNNEEFEEFELGSNIITRTIRRIWYRILGIDTSKESKEIFLTKLLIYFRSGQSYRSQEDKKLVFK